MILVMWMLRRVMGWSAEGSTEEASPTAETQKLFWF